MSEVTDAKREFKYGQLVLQDPDINMTPDQVKEFYASSYPELTQSVIEGPDYKEDTVEYTFKKAVGTKG